MGTQESTLLWEQMDMGAITRDFDRLFPGFSFDGEAVFADIMQGTTCSSGLFFKVSI